MSTPTAPPQLTCSNPSHNPIRTCMAPPLSVGAPRVAAMVRSHQCGASSAPWPLIGGWPPTTERPRWILRAAAEFPCEAQTIVIGASGGGFGALRREVLFVVWASTSEFILQVSGLLRCCVSCLCLSSSVVSFARSCGQRDCRQCSPWAGLEFLRN